LFVNQIVVANGEETVTANYNQVIPHGISARRPNVSTDATDATDATLLQEETKQILMVMCLL